MVDFVLCSSGCIVAIAYILTDMPNDCMLLVVAVIVAFMIPIMVYSNKVNDERLQSLESYYNVSNILNTGGGKPELTCRQSVRKVAFTDSNGDLIEGRLSIDGCTAKLFAKTGNNGKYVPYETGVDVPSDTKRR